LNQKQSQQEIAVGNYNVVTKSQQFS